MVGSVVLPGLAILALMLVPFIDRGRMVQGHAATVAMACVLLAVIGWTGLTVAAVATTPKPARQVADRLLGAHGLDAAHAGGDGRRCLFPQGELRQLPRRGRGQAEGGTGSGDASRSTRRGLDDPAFQTAVGDGAGIAMPPIQLSDAQLNALAAFLLKLNPDNAERAGERSRFRHRRARWFTRPSSAASCHMVNGVRHEDRAAAERPGEAAERSWVVDTSRIRRSCRPARSCRRIGCRRKMSTH